MKFKILLILFLLSGITACADAEKCGCSNSETSYSPAVNTGCYGQKIKYVPVPVAGQLMSLKRRCPKRLVGVAAIRAANKKSIRQPNSGEYINSIMTFDYMPGALYQIYTAPLNVTDIQFQNNEHLVAVGAGDTMRWQVSKTYSGAGGTRQEHLLIKPIDEGLTNGLVVTTDVRTYHLMLHSTCGTYMASVAWRYPDDDGILQNINDAPSYGSTGDSISSLDINRIDCNYKIELVKGPRPDWMPKAVFNDGNKTYIQFPNMQNAPTLLIGNDVKTDQLVNYRVEGNYYIVDSLFPQAQLRSTECNGIIVQITYNNKCNRCE